MKKIILSILTLCACIPAYAQSFNGVELSGTRTEFIKKYLNAHPNAEVLWDIPERHSTMIKDSFLGYKVNIAIDKLANRQDDNIHSLWFDIVLSSNLNWKDITSRYEEILSYLITQYGTPHPIMHQRKFEYPFNNGNHYNREILALELGKCVYSDMIPINNELLLSINIIHTYDPVNPNVEYNAISIAIMPNILT